MIEVIAVVGPTASGKSALALRAAEALGGEIVSADSRQVYRGMDIGTDKPTVDERARVPHHLIDVADPEERYDVSRYQREARVALAGCAARGVPAIVVGGTGLYVRALLDGLALSELPSDPSLRAELERRSAAEGAAALQAELRAHDPAAAAWTDPRNVRRVIRYLEIAMLAGTVPQRRAGAIAAPRVGLDPPRDALYAAIERRVRAMVDAGVLAEAARLLERGIDLRLPSMTAHGYLHWVRHLRREIELASAIALTARDVRAYSRRQMTWFRRDRSVRWVDPGRTDPLPALLDAIRR